MGSSARAPSAILAKIDSIPAPDLHRYCNGNAAQYGFSPAHGRELVMAFAELLRKTDDPVLRARLERASVCAWRLLAEPWWPRGWRLDLAAPAPAPELDDAIYQVFAIVPQPDVPRPVAATLQLCVRHGIDRDSENRSVKDIVKLLGGN
jgi:hypothetical protein